MNCKYCDTNYSRDILDGLSVKIEDIVGYARSANVPLVEITGGEPLLQDDTPELCKRLLEEGFEVLVETNGSLPLSELPEGVIRIMDCKTPSSGEADKIDFDNFALLNSNDEVKFVISDRADFKYSLNIIEKYKLAEFTDKLIFGPAWGKLKPAKLVKWMMREKPPARMQLQLHKYIWDPDAKGV